MFYNQQCYIYIPRTPSTFLRSNCLIAFPSAQMFVGSVSMVKFYVELHQRTANSWSQLFEGRLALNPGLNLTLVSLSCVQTYFLGQFSLLYLELSIINS